MYFVLVYLPYLGNPCACTTHCAGATNIATVVAMDWKSDHNFLLYCSFNILKNNISKITTSAAMFDVADPIQRPMKVTEAHGGEKLTAAKGEAGRAKPFLL